MTTPSPLILPSRAGSQVVNVAETAELACAFLAGQSDIFRKGKQVVRLCEGVLEPVTPHHLTTILFGGMDVREWRMKDGPNLIEATVIKDNVLNTILHGDFVTKIRPVAIIAQTPFLVLDDGKLVVLSPGYNAVRGGILVTGSAVIPEVPVQEAVCVLKGLLKDYHFESHCDAARAIAAFIAAGFRLAGIYERHPLLVFEADQSQSGKTFMFYLIVHLFGQRCGTVAQKHGGTGSLDETLMEKLIAGYPMILFDNIRGKINSPFLEMCLTPESGFIDARVLRASVQVDPRVVVFAMTSNAAELTPDLANRSMMIRIKKQPPGYVFSTWKGSGGQDLDLGDFVKTEHLYLLGCVNAIILNWWNSGAKKLPSTHDFRHTMGALDYIVQHYFGMFSLLDGHRDALNRTANPGMTWLRQIALKAASEWKVSEWSATQLAEQCLRDGHDIPGVRSEDADVDSVSKNIGRILNKIFAGTDVLTVEGVTVTRSTVNRGKNYDMKVYTFKLEV